MPCKKSFIAQASSVKIAGYWPCCLFAFLWTSTSSQSIKDTKRELGCLDLALGHKFIQCFSQKVSPNLANEFYVGKRLEARAYAFTS